MTFPNYAMTLRIISTSVQRLHAYGTSRSELRLGDNIDTIFIEYELQLTQQLSD